VAEKLFKALNSHPDFQIETYGDGTNVVKLHVRNRDTEQFRENLRMKNIIVNQGAERKDSIILKINPSILRQEIKHLADSFIQAKGEG